jgi:hypothetical protein
MELNEQRSRRFERFIKDSKVVAKSTTPVISIETARVVRDMSQPLRETSNEYGS